MRRTPFARALLLAVLAVAPLSSPPIVALAGEPAETQLPPLKVTIDKSKVDLDAHHLEVRLSRTASHVSIKVFGESGALLTEEQQDFSGKPAGTPLVVTWHPSSGETVARIDVFGYDDKGYYSGVRIVPWSVRIPHEEVQFDTNQAVIRDSEEPKLEDSLKKIGAAVSGHEDLGPITLFVAGHTDTRGSAAHNLTLSRNRARAIASWFRHHGLKLSIAYEGFGESSPLVKTADEVDEPRNRRVDYVLSIEEPRFESTGGRPAWKRL
jgi:outer membrane protein OmpA-like peptidoglycan-associated protein